MKDRPSRTRYFAWLSGEAPSIDTVMLREPKAHESFQRFVGFSASDSIHVTLMISRGYLCLSNSNCAKLHCKSAQRPIGGPEMDYVARAKSLLAGKARTGALLVLPLAAAVQQAHAVVTATQPTLPSGDFSCRTTGNSGSCISGGVQADVGIGLTGDGFYSPGLNIFIGGNSPDFIDFAASGPLTGPSGGGLLAGSTIGEAYNFTINNSSGGFTGGTWSLFYQITDVTSGGVVLSDSSQSGSGGGTFSGSFTDQLSGPINVGDTLQIVANLNLDPAVTHAIYFVTIPGGDGPPSTLDIGTSATAPSAPEPSTLSFGALALAIAGVWYRLRRKKTANLQ